LKVNTVPCRLLAGGTVNQRCQIGMGLNDFRWIFYCCYALLSGLLPMAVCSGIDPNG
jgi:hypothetical protein